MLKRNQFYIAALCCAIGFAMTACGGKSGALTPSVTTLSKARFGQGQVVVHSIHALEAARSSTANAGQQYSGNVVTLPAAIYSPTGITYDPDDGNLYSLTTSGNAQIERITPSGAETTLLQFGYELNGIVYDHATQTFYVTTNDTCSPSGCNFVPSIYAVTTSGQYSVLAGGAMSGFQDGQGSAASFYSISGITLNEQTGVLYVADLDRVRAVTTAGAVTTYTPGGSIGPGNYTGYPATGITWNSKDGNLYVADSATDTIKKIAPPGTTTVLAGRCITNGYACTSLQRDGKGKDALFAVPTGIVAAPGTGNLYVTDSQNNSIREITSTGTVTTLAGSGIAQRVDGAGLNADLSYPIAIAMAKNGMLYELEGAQSQGGAIRSVTTTGVAPPPPTTPITMFDTKTLGAQPFAIDWRAPATSLWYTELTGHIASLAPTGISTEYNAASTPQFGDATDIVLDSKGTPWYYDPVDGAISHRMAGRLVSYKMFEQYSNFLNIPDVMANGPDGNIWIADYRNSNSVLDIVKPNGSLSDIPAPANFYSQPIAFSSDGSLWLMGNSQIGRFDLHGNLISSYNVPASFMTEAPDGNMLFTLSDAVGKINVATGIIDEYPIFEPIPSCPQNQQCSRNIGRIATGSDGSYVFTENGIGYIGRLNPTTGAFSEYPVPAAHSSAFDVMPGPDGNVWFTDTGAEKVGRLKLH